MNEALRPIDYCPPLPRIATPWRAWRDIIAMAILFTLLGVAAISALLLAVSAPPLLLGQ